MLDALLYDWFISKGPQWVFLVPTDLLGAWIEVSNIEVNLSCYAFDNINRYLNDISLTFPR